MPAQPGSHGTLEPSVLRVFEALPMALVSAESPGHGQGHNRANRLPLRPSCPKSSWPKLGRPARVESRSIHGYVELDSILR